MDKPEVKYSLFQKLFYAIVGFPPRPQPLSDEAWDKWKDRFNKPEYDWKHHAGKSGQDN